MSADRLEPAGHEPQRNECAGGEDEYEHDRYAERLCHIGSLTCGSGPTKTHEIAYPNTTARPRAPSRPPTPPGVWNPTPNPTPVPTGCRALDPAVAISAVQLTEVERARRGGDGHRRAVGQQRALPVPHPARPLPPPTRHHA